jgi:hypothetical protein
MSTNATELTEYGRVKIGGNGLTIENLGPTIRNIPEESTGYQPPSLVPGIPWYNGSNALAQVCISTALQVLLRENAVVKCQKGEFDEPQVYHV